MSIDLVNVNKYKRALLLEALRITEINLGIIEHLNTLGSGTIPKSVYYQQLSRIPDNVTVYIRDAKELIDIAILKEMPYGIDTGLNGFDMRELNGIEIDRVISQLNELIEYYSSKRNQIRGLPLKEVE